jgi:hypothetical protein
MGIDLPPDRNDIPPISLPDRAGFFHGWIDRGGGIG